MKSLIGLFLFSLLIVICPNLVFAEQKQLKIGVVLPLTGNTASYGVDPMRGLKILENGINEKNEVKLKFIFEDGRCGSGNATINAVNKLLNVDKVDAFILGCSGEILQAAPVLKKAKKVAFCYACSHRDVKHQGKYVYRTYIDIERGINFLSDYIKSKNNLKLAVLSEDVSFTLGIKKLLHENFSNGDSFFYDFNESETDFRTIVLKAKNKTPDAYFLNAASPNTYQNILRQLNELGVKKDLYAYYQPKNRDNKKNLGKLQDGMVFISYPQFKSKDKKYLKLMEKFLVKYPEGPFDEFLQMTIFDAATVLFEALKVSKNSEDIIKFINNYKNIGALGNISFDNNGDIEGINFNIYEINNNVIRKLG